MYPGELAPLGMWSAWRGNLEWSYRAYPVFSTMPSYHTNAMGNPECFGAWLVATVALVISFNDSFVWEIINLRKNVTNVAL